MSMMLDAGDVEELKRLLRLRSDLASGIRTYSFHSLKETAKPKTRGLAKAKALVEAIDHVEFCLGNLLGADNLRKFSGHCSFVSWIKQDNLRILNLIEPNERG